VLVIDVLDAQGQPDRLRLPLYDVLIDDAEAVWALLIGYLRLLGAAYAVSGILKLHSGGQVEMVD
jgi:hypothetical protein